MSYVMTLFFERLSCLWQWCSLLSFGLGEPIRGVYNPCIIAGFWPDSQWTVEKCENFFIHTLWNRFVASLSTQKKILHTHPASGYINGWVNFKSVIKTIWYYFVVIRQYFFFQARYSIEKFKIISLILPPLQKNCSLSLNIPSLQKNKFGCLTWKINKIKVIYMQLTQKGKDQYV